MVSASTGEPYRTLPTAFAYRQSFNSSCSCGKAQANMTPVPHADFVTTTTHKTLRGPRGGLILCREKYAKEVDSMIFPGIQGGPLEQWAVAWAIVATL